MVDQGNKFYSNSFKKWLDDNDIKMYSTYNEGKSVVAERLTRTLKNKIYKHMTGVSKNVYFDVLIDIVDKYNNAYHRTIKTKSIDVKSYSYAKYNVDSNDKSDLEKKISDSDKKIPDTSELVEKADYNAKTTEIEGKLPGFSGLATTTALTSVEHKILNVNNLVKKTDYNTKINEIAKKITDHNHDKYFITPEFNKLTTENFAEAILPTKSDIADFVNKTDFED